MPIFIVKNNPDFSVPIQLDASDEHHIVRVLRTKVGETLAFTNNQGWIAQTRITQIKPLSFEIIEKYQQEQPLPITLYLPVIAQDRLEWAIEKLTELNIKTVQLIVTEYTQNKTIAPAKWQRLERVTITAQKQCIRAYPLEICKPEILNETLLMRDTVKIVAQKEDGTQQLEKLSTNIMSDGKSIGIFLGPEGGFTADEITVFEKQGCHKVSLGPTILRTETAAITLASLILRGAL